MLAQILTQLLNRNAIRVLGFEIKEVVTADDITEATMIIFPGVGNFGQALKVIYCTGNRRIFVKI